MKHVSRMHVIITDKLQECLTTCTSCIVQKHMLTMRKAPRVKKLVPFSVRPPHAHISSSKAAQVFLCLIFHWKPCAYNVALHAVRACCACKLFVSLWNVWFGGTVVELVWRGSDMHACIHTRMPLSFGIAKRSVRRSSSTGFSPGAHNACCCNAGQQVLPGADTPFLDWVIFPGWILSLREHTVLPTTLRPPICLSRRGIKPGIIDALLWVWEGLFGLQ
jgi:hypothetical protein